PLTEGGDIHWNDTGVWTNDAGSSVFSPTVGNGANNHDIFIANNANVIFGRDAEVSNVRYLKIGALGNAGSSSAGLYSQITNPNGRLTINGGTLNVSSSNFNIG